MNLIIPPTLDPITESPQPTPLSEETASTTTTTTTATKGKELKDNMMAGTPATGSNIAGTGLNTATSTESFDVNGAYIRALNDEQVSRRAGINHLWTICSSGFMVSVAIPSFLLLLRTTSLYHLSPYFRFLHPYTSTSTYSPVSPTESQTKPIQTESNRTTCPALSPPNLPSCTLNYLSLPRKPS